MRRSAMLGTALIVIGGTVFLRGLSDPAKFQRAEPGAGVVPAQESGGFTPWVSGLAAIVGLVLVYSGRRRSSETWQSRSRNT